jgi:hypothetical protein
MHQYSACKLPSFDICLAMKNRENLQEKNLSHVTQYIRVDISYEKNRVMNVVNGILSNWFFLGFSHESRPFP